MPTLQSMKVKLLGKKIGMTQLSTELGMRIPVTVIQFEPHVLVQKKTEASEGYDAFQMATRAVKRLNKPELGHLKSHGVEALYGDLFEFEVTSDAQASEGDVFDVSVFDDIEYVDVSGLTKGRGFAGVVKRWGHKTQPASHGNSLSGRVTGSLGANQDPGRVWKNKKMPGHYGFSRVSVQNLKVVRIDKERQLLFVKGAVPGANGFQVIVKPAEKK